MSFPVLKSVLRWRIISWNTFLQTSRLQICWSFMGIVFACPLKWNFGRTGRRATGMFVRLQGFDQIVELMLLRLKYTGHSFLSPQMFVRCILSELLNRGTNIAPSSHHSYWRGQNHRSYDEIFQTFLFIAPPVAWYDRWVDMFRSTIKLLCWGIRHRFPECRVLPEELNALNRIAVKEMYVRIILKIVWIGQMIVKHIAWLPRVHAHGVAHLIQHLE